MNTSKPWLATFVGLVIGLLLAWAWTAWSPTGAAIGQQRPAAPPSFTEEREAAALFFVKKNLPELIPLLNELKKNSPQRYEQQIGRIFQATELLAALRDDPLRRDLELKIWRAENKANMLVARLTVASETDRAKVERDLAAQTRELVDLEIAVVKLKSDQLTREMADVNAELDRSRAAVDKLTAARYEAYLAKAQQLRK